MKRFALMFRIFAGVFFWTQLVEAKDDTNVAVKFQQAIMREENDLAQTYLASGVTIPEIREKSPLKSCQLVPSPNENVKVLLANFWDEQLGGERLALIWELVVKDKKITKIRTVYDGANPLMDEVRLIKEYQNKYQKRVLVPTEFPFKITHFRGEIVDRQLVLYYRNEPLKGFLQIIMRPVSVELERYKGADDQYYLLKNGTKVLYRTRFELGYELRFQHEGMQYTVAIGNKKYLKKRFNVHDLIKIAESMK